MSLPPPDKKRGRPSLDEADVLRAKACWHWVHNRSGLNNEALEMLLTPASIRYDGLKVIRPRKWDRYERGQMCPKDDGTAEGTVGCVERYFPGFRTFYSHPLWDAIGPKNLSEDDLIALMRKLPTLKSLLFEIEPVPAPSGEAVFPSGQSRRRALDAEVLQSLRETMSMDGLAAFILMAREAAILGSPVYRSTALMGYRSQVQWLRVDNDFAPIATEFSDLVDRRFMQQAFAYLNRRLSIHIVTKNFTDEELAG